jgi:casein kinase 1
LQGEEDYNDYGLSTIFEAGSDERINYVITDLLGQSLDRYMADNGGVLDLRMACELGVQMIERIEFIHSKGYVHRDLRPEHFLLGRPKKPNRLYLTGLTMARKYLYPDGRHAIYRDNKPSFTGTARYMSINAQLGI